MSIVCALVLFTPIAHYHMDWSKMRFIVFWGDTCYPAGGMKDKHEEFEEYDEAVAFARGVLKGRGWMHWVHVYDRESNDIVFEDIL
jgi:hypothetical protein